jgi:hypothetical protein
MAISLAPSLIARLGPLIGGGIMASDPNKIQQLLQTFGSSPLAQILQARDDDIIDLDEEREKREADNETSVEEKAKEIEEKAKDIEKEGSAADQFDDIMGDLFGVRRRESKVIDLPQEEEIPGQEDEEIKVKDTEELEGAKELKEQVDKAKNFEMRQKKQQNQMLKENERMTEEVINQEFKDQNISPIDAKRIAKQIVDGYDEGILDPQEIVNQVRSYFGLKMGGMVDKAISYEPRN